MFGNGLRLVYKKEKYNKQNIRLNIPKIMSESIVPKDEQDTPNTDFVDIGGSIVTSINYKVAFFLFFIGMVVFSDVFINLVLMKCSDCTSGECTTSKGTIIQLLVLTVSYVVLDLLVQKKWL